jgi:hypothetical protein
MAEYGMSWIVTRYRKGIQSTSSIVEMSILAFILDKHIEGILNSEVTTPGNMELPIRGTTQDSAREFEPTLI